MKIEAESLLILGHGATGNDLTALAARDERGGQC
jgi:hypothetical protein